MLHRRRVRSSQTSPEFSSTSVFITPMLDMSFQILAFFVVTFQPPALEGRLPLENFKGQEGGPKEVVKSTKAQPTTTTELPPPITIVARADRKGRLEKIFIHVDGDEEPREPIQGPDPDKLITDLQKALIKLKENYAGEKRITFEYPYLLYWEYSVAIMDACRGYRDSRGRERELFPKIETEMK